MIRVVRVDDCAWDAEIELVRELDRLSAMGITICPRCRRSYMAIERILEDTPFGRCVVYGYRCTSCNLWRPFEEVVIEKNGGDSIVVKRKFLRMSM